MSDQGPLSLPEPAYEGWAIVELMGHRQVAGRVSEVQIAGATLLRVDVPGRDETVVSQFYGGASIYCLTPCDEAAARDFLRQSYGLPPAVALAFEQEQARRQPSLPGMVEEPSFE